MSAEDRRAPASEPADAGATEAAPEGPRVGPRPEGGGDPEDLWTWRRSPPVRRWQRFLLLVLIGAGVLATLRFGDWWFRAEHVGNPVLFVLLSAAVWYGVSRIVLRWVNLTALERPEHVPPEEGLDVAIFTTSTPGEPLEMYEKTLAACREVRYPHTTYLLDETGDPAYRQVAERHGAELLDMQDVGGAKAGNINRALELTDEEFVLVLDPDHVPFPNFLHRVLGHFRDPEVGFVQVAQGYYNQFRSFVARGAAEQTYHFYGPTLMGLFGHGGSVAIGANCTFRREALESIGGHGIGLAEDLVTAIRLHAGGWRSVYVPEVVSRGLVPEDLGSFYRQQLKWARGVYEVLLDELPRLWPDLDWRQRLSYGAIGTYYLVGVTTPIYLLIPYLYLWVGARPAAMDFTEFLVQGAPLALVGVAVYLAVQRWLVHPAVERGLHLRAMSLKIACWPVYLAGTVLALMRVDLPYIPTAKEAARGAFLKLAAPHLALLVLYAASVAVFVRGRFMYLSEGSLMLTAEAAWAMVGFATVAALQVGGGVYGAWEATGLPDAAPFSEVPEPGGGNSPDTDSGQGDGQ